MAVQSEVRPGHNITATLGLIVDLLWTLTLYWFYIFEAIWLFFVPPTPKDVKGEIVLITGTGHGMGREMALRFASLGAHVVCVDINPKGNDETYEIIKEEKGKAFKFECDVTDRAAVMQLAERVRKEVGEVTILVNNAGIMPVKPMLKQTEQDIRLMMDINVNGNLWMIQAFLPSMMEQNRGHIVAMSSMAGLVGLKNLVPYCGSKFAVRGIMEALYTELRQDERNYSGIKLTTIHPYIVDTGLAKNPNIRFEKFFPLVKPGDAADKIVDAVRREYTSITVPGELFYLAKINSVVPLKSVFVINNFIGTSCE